MPIFRFKVCPLAFLVLLGAMQAGAQPWSRRPDAVAGQINLVHVERNFVDGRGFSSARDVAVDTSVVPNRVYVFDFGNNRVLGWRNVAALTNGAPADLVLGQPDFFTNSCGRSRQKLCMADPGWSGSLAVDANGNVYVADTGNFRVLEFDSPFTSDTLADRVFGANDFTSLGCPIDANNQLPPNTPCLPSGLALDRAGNLYVSDRVNGANGAAVGVYVYRQPLTTDAVADVHIGHTRCEPPLDSSSFCAPEGLALDAEDNLYVSDPGVHRVLVFRSPLTTDGVADLVLGQPDFTTTRGFVCNPIDPAPLPADQLCGPSSVAVDAGGHLWVADRFHNRILGYDSPLTTDTVPDRVLGKRGSLTSGASTCGVFDLTPPTRDLLCGPRGLALDSQGALWVAESSHRRVTRISAPLTAGAVADLVLGQVDFVHGTENLVDGRGFSGPMTAAVDRASSPPHLYVLDAFNHRVLAWRDAEDLAAGLPADLVLGQPDLFSNRCNQGGRVSARGFCFLDFMGTGGLAVDGAGNLYVSDTGNNRILEFDSPFTTDTVADRVFGQQGSFTTGRRNKGGVSAGSLYLPAGLAVDRQGNLYVADMNNYRVLRYDQPLRQDTVADRVYGKQGRFDLGVRPASANCRGGRDLLCRPRSVAVDGAGNLYVSDSGNHRVLQYDRFDDLPERVFGQKGSFREHVCGIGQDRLCEPAGIAIAPSGALYVVARTNRLLVRYSPPFRQTQIDLVIRGFVAPTGVAVDPAGTVYVTDELNRVLVFDNP